MFASGTFAVQPAALPSVLLSWTDHLPGFSCNAAVTIETGFGFPLNAGTPGRFDSFASDLASQPVDADWTIRIGTDLLVPAIRSKVAELVKKNARARRGRSEGIGRHRRPTPRATAAIGR